MNPRKISAESFKLAYKSSLAFPGRTTTLHPSQDKASTGGRLPLIDPGPLVMLGLRR